MAPSHAPRRGPMAGSTRVVTMLAACGCLHVACVHAEVHADSSEPPSLSSTANANDLNNRGVQKAKDGRLEQGIALLRQALVLSPSDHQLQTNLSGMLADWARQLEQQGQLDRAATTLEEAVGYDPDNGYALIQLGDLAYLTRSDFSRAIALWQRAHGHVSAAVWQMVARRIGQAERDQTVERTFSHVKTAHFSIRYDGAQHADQALALEHILEEAYAKLSETMATSPEDLAVILYPGNEFQRVAGRRDWAFGLYDGRIRIRLDEVGTAMAPQILSHELAHAFLARTYGAHIPSWIHEGFAQSQESPNPLTQRPPALLEAVRSRTAWVPLRWLDRRFAQPSNYEDVERAYVEAQVVVEALIKHSGMSGFQAFLTALSHGQPIEQAFDQTFAPLRWSRMDQGILE